MTHSFGFWPSSVTSLGLSFPSSKIMIKWSAESSLHQRAAVGPKWPDVWKCWESKMPQSTDGALQQFIQQEPQGCSIGSFACSANTYLCQALCWVLQTLLQNAHILVWEDRHMRKVCIGHDIFSDARITFQLCFGLRNTFEWAVSLVKHLYFLLMFLKCPPLLKKTQLFVVKWKKTNAGQYAQKALYMFQQWLPLRG